MGLGDEIMAAAQARALSRASGKLVCIVDKAGKPRTHDLWQGLPWITQSTKGAQILLNAPGARPYIDYTRTTPERWAYTSWRCEPGEIAGIEPDPTYGRGVIILEPNIKANASPNKQWGQGNWLQLARELDTHRLRQMVAPGQVPMPGIKPIYTRTFREACSVLMNCRAAVLPEGGLHHAAAALGKRAVVLFGAMTSPANTGYDLHENIWIDDPSALGWRIRHPACDRAWAQITPRMVAATLKKVLDES